MWVRFPPPALGFERLSTIAVIGLDKIWTRRFVLSGPGAAYHRTTST